VEEYPELLEQVNDTIRNFIDDPNSRTKKVVPNLGEFLPYLAVTDTFSWEDVREAYILECFDRNVKWTVEKFPHLKKIPQVTSPGIVSSRITKTFEAIRVSQRLLMFHVYFFRNIAKPENTTINKIKAMYDTLYGMPTHAVKEELQVAIKDILKVDDWVKFFDRIDIPLPSTDQLYSWLCDSVQRSEAKRYHFRDPKPRNYNNNNKQDQSKPKLGQDEHDRYYNY